MITDILTIIILIVAVLLGIGVLWMIIYLQQDRSWKEDVNVRIAVLDQNLSRVQEFTVRLDSSPQFRGRVGEDVVRLSLSDLPSEYITEQYTGTDIPGRPDFVVELPNIPEKLVIDAKMSFPDGEIHVEKFRNILMKRSSELKKYIVPGVTHDFVLMWIPDSAYSLIDNKVARHFFTTGVVPVTTPSMLGVIHLLRRAHQAFKLNSLTSKFVIFHEKIQTEFKLTQTAFDKARTQFSNAYKNFELTAQTMFKLGNSIETFEETLDDEI